MYVIRKILNILFRYVKNKRILYFIMKNNFLNVNELDINKPIVIRFIINFIQNFYYASER